MGCRAMTRTLPFGKVEPEPSRPRAISPDFADGQSLVAPGRYPHGTPVPPAAPAAEPARAMDPLLDTQDSLDLEWTAPVERQEIELEAEPGPEPEPPLEMVIDDVGMRTVMGIGARAVRAVAKSGLVEARPARRGLRATPDTPFPPAFRPSGPLPSSPRVIVSPLLDDAPAPQSVAPQAAPEHGAGRVLPIPAPDESLVGPMVQPIQRQAEAPPLRAAVARQQTPAPVGEVPPISVSGPMPAPTPAPVLAPAAAMIAIAPAPAEMPIPGEPWSQPRARANSGRGSSSVGLRVLGVAVLTFAVLAIATYITATVFYAFSTTWAMPVTISPSDDKVVALRASLATQQHQRDKLAAELAGTAPQATAEREALRLSIARQDEIIKDLEQSPYLRALADGAPVALVPYENLAGVAPGTQVVACNVAMVMCRPVGRVREILAGEVAFKHPRRDKAMRGQVVELELSERDAAAKDLLFLGGAPLLF
jgi:hypothetical protein